MITPYVLAYKFENNDEVFYYSGFVRIVQTEQVNGPYILSKIGNQFSYFSNSTGECNVRAIIYTSLEFAQNEAKRIEQIHNSRVDNKVHVFVKTLDSVLQNMLAFYKPV
jgi:hypothetical protein